MCKYLNLLLTVLKIF